ncbi:MAG: sodium-dependent transporter, partial [Pseudohongiellaceae bacterium]
KNPVGAFSGLSDNSRLWRAVGRLAVITPFMIAVFYTVITVWIALYMVEAAFGNLTALAQPEAFGRFAASPVLFLYLVPLLALVFYILSGGVKDGIEKAARIMMPALLVLLVVLVMFVLTLDNASAGLAYYLVPDFSKINSSVVNGALNQAFFSLSLGMGILITYGSYFSRQDSIPGSARMVAITDSSVAFIAGLLILPAVFAMNPEIQADELSDSSIGMIFSFLPQIFLSMQEVIGYFGASLVATVFFILVFFAALTSLVSITEIPIAYLVDEKEGYTRRMAIGIISILLSIFVVMATVSFGMVDWLTGFVSYGGISKSFFDVILDVFYETVLPLVGFTVCIFCSYRWQRGEFAKELATGEKTYMHSLLQKYVTVALSTFIPVLLLAVFANNVAQIFFAYNLLGF